MPVPYHSVFTGRMPFLPPNQQHQNTVGLFIKVANTSETVWFIQYIPTRQSAWRPPLQPGTHTHSYIPFSPLNCPRLDSGLMPVKGSRNRMCAYIRKERILIFQCLHYSHVQINLNSSLQTKNNGNIIKCTEGRAGPWLGPPAAHSLCTPDLQL